MSAGIRGEILPWHLRPEDRALREREEVARSVSDSSGYLSLLDVHAMGVETQERSTLE